MKRSSKKVLVGVMVVVAAVAFLIYRGVSTTGAYYLTVTELRTSEVGLGLGAGEVVRVGGDVVPGTVAYDQRDLVLEFSIRDPDRPDQMLAARYEGPKPDAFEPEIEVLLEGTFDRDRNLFRAENLLVKCPSKYQSEEES